MSSIPSTVLLFGKDPYLLDTRRLVLQRSGYQVRTTNSLDEVHRILAEGDIDLLVLCHSLSPAECQHAHEQAADAAAKVLLLFHGTSECRPQPTDALLNVWEGPASLLEATARLVRHSQAPV